MTAAPQFERLAVLGLGLLGGSVARAARARGVVRRAVGSGRRAEALAAAVRAGVVDETAPVEEAVAGADLVVLATPVHAMAGTLRRAAPHLAPGALVTDVGSVKGVLAETLPGLLPEGVPYVGSHPMAGSHLRGVEHARADLFEGAPCVVAPVHPERDGAPVARLSAFWGALGARVVVRDPAVHDAEVAWVSHVPHVLAFAFARALESAPAGAGGLAGSGFRDFSRIARSDAELWSDILGANAKAIAGPLRTVADRLAELARDLEAGDAWALERSIGAARAALARTAHREEDSNDLGARSGGTNPEIPGRPRGGLKGDRNE